MPADEPQENLSDALRDRLRTLSEKPGVYLMRDRLGAVLYVGKAKNLRRRVSSYFTRSRAQLHSRKVAAMVALVADIETIEVRSEPEALLLEGRLIKQYKPKYNTDFIDDKRFPLVRVDLGEELPRFRITRLRRDDRSRYFGPFPYGGLLRRTLAQLRKQFGILLLDTQPFRQPDGLWRLYDDARAEIYGHPNLVTAAEYRLRVDAACAFLEGRSREILATLREEMLVAASAQEFEKAASLRDAVFALEKTIERTRKFERDHPVVVTDEGALVQLAAALGLPHPPTVMECFDISHISGTFVVASMVHFRDGRPDRAQYRRFQIRSFVGNDDFRAMEEVVGRRYGRLKEEGKPFPDLVVIDGGLGQIASAVKAFIAIGAELPALIGLAKKEETILFPDGRPPLKLSLSHPGLNLLQRLRDEAHRFANTYNADLRSRRIRESVLDEFPGIGETRRAALFRHFGDIARLRAATREQIQEVEGFGPRLAAELHAFLAGTSVSSEAQPPEAEPS